MKLSDEDYGILYNFLDEGTGILAVCFICKQWMHSIDKNNVDKKSFNDWGGMYFVEQLAMLIILSEGRELP